MGFTRLTPSKPTIAAISGWCLAGGLELALWCDLRIATETARLGFTERRFGVPLIDGGTQRLPRIVGMGRALEMILTGRVVEAEEALDWGLRHRGRRRGQAPRAGARDRRGPGRASRRRRCSPTAARRSRAPGCRSRRPRARGGARPRLGRDRRSRARRASPPARAAAPRAPASERPLSRRASRNSVSRRFSVSPSTSATTSTWPSSGVPRSLVASRSSTWKMPAELFILISIRTARSSPASIVTSSIAAAESEWMPTRPASTGSARAALRHVERVGDPHHPGLERVGLAAAAVADDRVQGLGDDDRALGLLVDVGEQLACSLRSARKRL